MVDVDEVTGFDAWAAEAAEQVMAHVERHGVAITWGEAYNGVLVHAHGFGVHSDHPDEPDDQTVADPLGWQHPDFIESVACGSVHSAGRAHHPTRPRSEVPVGVSVHTLVEAHVRLSLLLQISLASPSDKLDSARLASLVTELAFHLGTDYLADIDEGTCRDTLEGSPYVLLRAHYLLSVIELLGQGESAIATYQHLLAGLPPETADHLADPAQHRLCIVALRWWLGLP